jgi:hypothetical protein
MTITYSAPLASHMWSWGAVRLSDGAVFLRVWQDRERKIDGKWYSELTHHKKYQDKPDNLGFQERLRHVEAIPAGARSYLVMCEAKDPKASPRAIKGFNGREVFVGGALIEIDGDFYVERIRRKSISDVMPPSEQPSVTSND